VKHLWLYLKGIAMGSADVVPGVSGGTIAFITGIYTELLDSIKAVNLQALIILFKQGPKAAWKAINGTFLVTLLAGILTAILTLAKVIHYLLDQHAVLLWSFFFGLILASSLHMAKQIKHWQPTTFMALFVGALIAAIISIASPTSIEASYLNIFIAGSIAICAMILPGISGSFILLLMGLYAPVLAAVKGFQLDIMLIFALGAVLGLMLFSRLLSWLLHHYQDLMFSLLTGFMLGALLKVWPWKETISYRLNSKGVEVPFEQLNRLPDWLNGDQIMPALVLALIGFACVILLEKFSSHDSEGKR
jgi:putative membrane protein|tara:strand:- start:4302 stop:5216 length:915 start_codon:yes stop_codon:yes gene_type:complete